MIIVMLKTRHAANSRNRTLYNALGKLGITVRISELRRVISIS